jgi:hypothetical protein
MDIGSSLSRTLSRGLGIRLFENGGKQNKLSKRRKIHLQPISTNLTSNAVQDNGNSASRTNIEEESVQDVKGGEHGVDISGWSTSTRVATVGSSSSTRSLETEAPDHETYKERLARHQAFFATCPLMRCLDTEEEKEDLADLLFENLLTEVKEPSPVKHKPLSYRGIIQIRAFWEGVRRQLGFIDDEEEDCWPEGYPEHRLDHRPNTPDGLEEYLTSRWTIFQKNTKVEYQGKNTLMSPDPHCTARTEFTLKFPDNGNSRPLSNTYPRSIFNPTNPPQQHNQQWTLSPPKASSSISTTTSTKGK